MKGRPTTQKHEIAYQELTALVTRHAVGLTAAEVLAIAANMVGKLIALQDQRTMTREQAMEIVANNIELGNRTVIEQLLQSTGGRA